jgi:hypothetical protein
LTGPFGRLALAIVCFLMLTLDASAQTAAYTARAWGLIGAWSQDCSLAPDRNKGAVLAYEIAPDGRLVHRRDFGDTTDESEVISAEISSDGLMNLRVFFPGLEQTREFGMVMQPDGIMRAIYNRDQKSRYSIKDGKFTANGNPTPPLYKCRAEIGAIERGRLMHSSLLNGCSEFSSCFPGTFPGVGGLILAQPRSTA